MCISKTSTKEFWFCCLHNPKTVQFQTGSEPQKKNNSKATPAFTADRLKNSFAEDQQPLETIRLGGHTSNRLFLFLTWPERQGLCFCHKLAMATQTSQPMSDAQGKPSTSLLQWPQKKTKTLAVPRHARFARRECLSLTANKLCLSPRTVESE